MFKKRYLKVVATVLVAIFAATTFGMPVALASHRPPPPRHHGHHHDDWGTAIGIVAGLGIIGALINNNSSSDDPAMYQDYESYREAFIRNLDSGESELWFELRKLDLGEHKLQYNRDVTARRIKKFCRKLPEDFRFISESKSSKVIIIEKLRDDA